MKNRNVYFYSIPVIFTLLFTFCLTGVQASTPQSFAVLPFTIHADKDMSYVKKGISRMFYSRLSWPEKVAVIPPKEMEKVQATLKDVSGSELIKKVAQKTDAQYILSGTITRLAGSFSIDARVYDMENKRYMAFFEQSKNSDELVIKVDRIAAAINQKVFDRTTVTWEEMEQEKQKYLNDLKRKNPEHLMQVPAGWQPEEEVGWKVWKYLF
ncbi:MAG: hypothetical protein MI892_26555 [Desulfobacterales bacterium]|nr:hypothetical protein [Desulfobacterales bacterium]